MTERPDWITEGNMADIFGAAEEVTVQEALLIGSPVGSGSQLAGSVPTPP
ncbi:hypothetical protein [Micromonospora ureilytica]